MRIFVPGRLCLFGEHSDWAGEYRKINPEIEKGYTLIVGTNQGIYASVKVNSTELVIRSSLCDGRHYEPLRLPMESNTLKSVAQEGGFFSYAAGTAYQFLTHYGVGGLEVDNYLTDLPIQKGLSSSAAFCVLIARSFNRLYDLKMTIREEMELAYLGERTTPSLCGRMDQACAYGNSPILMIFDGEQIDLRKLTVSKDLFFVIVDLGGSKNTQEILRRLNESYPFATHSQEQNVQKYLGSISSEITQQAVEAIQLGNAQLLGALMTKAQAEFDRHVVPACPEQLTAKKLHLLLHHEPLRAYIFGGKGVGSQGDGTAQLIVKNQDSQRKAIEIIKRDFPLMQALHLTISKLQNSRIDYSEDGSIANLQ
ncbi:MAG: GHMP kinase [Aulosira sp. DedQUE10]|nr:GHMP kinase [Aulosira sp. DedQUE10]